MTVEILRDNLRPQCFFLYMPLDRSHLDPKEVVLRHLDRLTGRGPFRTNSLRGSGERYEIAPNTEGLFFHLNPCLPDFRFIAAGP